MSKIETIFNQKLDAGAEGNLGMDNDGRLYWNGKPVVTQSRITLDWWVNVSAVIASLSTLVIAVYTVLDFYCN